MFVYYTLVLASGERLRSYRGEVKSVNVCVYVYYIVHLMSGESLPNYRGHFN